MWNRRTLCYFFVVVMLLPLLLLRDFTPATELRYLSIADEALREGHLFAFTCHGEVYADKPPLYLWIIMACRCLLGQHVMPVLMLFSLVPAFVTNEVMVVWSRLKGDQAMFLRMMLLANVLFLVSALTLRMDMLMALFIVLAAKTFFDAYEQQRRLPLRFAVYVFLAVFTKGALGLLLPLCFILAFLESKHELRRFWHYLDWRILSLLVVLFGLWCGAVYLEAGGGYLYERMVHQTIGRAFLSFHHRQSIVYYFWLIWPLLIPWTLVVPGALLKSLRHDCEESDVTRFLATASLSGFILLSLISAKFSIYLLPLFPFILTLTARCLCAPYVSLRGGKVGERLITAGLVFACIIYQAGRPALSMLKHEGQLPEENRWCLVAAVIILSVFGIYALVYDCHRNHDKEAARSLFIGLYLSVFVLSFSLPGLNEKIGYRNLGARAAQLAARHHTTRFVTVGVKHGENMDVWLHHPVKAYPKDMPTDSLPRPAVVIYPEGPRYLPARHHYGMTK